MSKKETALLDSIEAMLRREGIRFAREVAIGGVRPDFIILSPDDRRCIVNVKSWAKFAGFRNRAAHLSDLWKSNLGVDEAFLVVGSLDRSRVSQGVVTVEKLIPTIKSAFLEQPGPKRTSKPISKDRGKHIFAAMPFDQKYDDAYFIAMIHAAENMKSVCVRVDKSEFSGDIVDEIHRLIQTSVAVIVDLSDARPNVLYEAGYAHALKKPTVHICSTPLQQLPFDVAQWNTLHYKLGQTYQLRGPLFRRLRASIEG